LVSTSSTSGFASAGGERSLGFDKLNQRLRFRWWERNLGFDKLNQRLPQPADSMEYDIGPSPPLWTVKLG
jgi:hypothetical protein